MTYKNRDLCRMFGLLATALLIYSISPSATALSQTKSSAARQSLSRGLLYYNNGDTTNDAAATEFEQVIKRYPSSSEAEDAQYYLGSYYQRKFFINKQSDPKVLTKAESAYREYISRYSNRGSREWLSDAEFNLSLVLLLERDPKKMAEAVQALNDMLDKSSIDRSVYIYQVVWLDDRKDVVDSNFDARQLAQFTRSLLSDKAASQSDAGQIIEQIKKWCQGQKGLKVK